MTSQKSLWRQIPLVTMLLLGTLLWTASVASQSTESGQDGRGQISGDSLTQETPLVSGPPIFSYQGQLLDASGAPISNPSLPVAFKLYSTGAGGSACWSEEHTIDVQNGLFHALLGQTVAIDPNVCLGGDAYLELVVNGETLSPRELLTSVAFAVRSQEVTDVIARNPNNQSAAVSLNWLNDTARIRVGGNGTGAAEGLDIQTQGDTSLLRILDNGNVGIGTTSPSERLEINGGELLIDNTAGKTWLNFRYDQGSSATTYYQHLATLSANNGLVQVEGLLSAHESSQGKASVDLIFSQRGGLVAQGIVNGQLNRSDILVYKDGDIYRIYLMTGAWSQVNLRLTTSGAPTLNTNPTLETTVTGTVMYSAKNNAQLVLNYAGNVGIDTTAPVIDLAIGDTDTGLQQQGDGRLGIFTNNAERIRIQEDGNVGLGVTSPAARLDIAAGSGYELRFSGAGGANIYAPDGDLFMLAGTGSRIHLGANGTNSQVVLQNGNIGIGTTAPGIDLAIGDTDTGLQQQGDGELGIFTNNQERVRIDSSGRIGFGTADPQHGRIHISSGAVPLVLQEADQTGAGSLWRMALDGRFLRFDVSQNGTDWTGAKTPLSMYSSGNVSTGGNLNMGGDLNMNGHSVVNCGAIVEANLQTEEEIEAGQIGRFEEGDVLCWGIDQLEICSAANDRLVQAVADEQGRPIVIGAELVKVLGPVQRGDILVASNTPGYAMVNNDPISGSVIAQALEDFAGESGVIKAMIRKW